MARARTIVLLRHAQARTDYDGEGHERPLTDAGRADAGALGDWLKAHDLRPQEVRCSTSVRTRETWAAAVESSGIGSIVEHDRRVYDATPDVLLDVLREVDPAADGVAVVGHAPGIPQLAHDLASPDSDRPALDQLAEGYPTCTAAVFEFDGEWADLAPQTARLRAVHTARAT